MVCTEFIIGRHFWCSRCFHSRMLQNTPARIHRWCRKDSRQGSRWHPLHYCQRCLRRWRVEESPWSWRQGAGHRWSQCRSYQGQYVAFNAVFMSSLSVIGSWLGDRPHWTIWFGWFAQQALLGNRWEWCHHCYQRGARWHWIELLVISWYHWSTLNAFCFP